MKNSILTVHNISKAYSAHQGKIVALRDVNLEIYEGEIISLLGVNGAGKTTLSSILATLRLPDKGTVYYRGNSLYEQLQDYRRDIGFCPQQPNFIRLLTVEENIFHAARCFGLDDDQARERTHYVIDAMGLHDYAYRESWQLSGGYQQRASIARALVHQPKILMLDEPTVGLDPHIRRHIWKLLEDLQLQGMTIILTTHYLDEAEELSDRVCILDKGVIRLVDTPQNLMHKYDLNRLEDVFIKLMEEEVAA